jgi:excisionase family DNA binding protein
MRDEVLTVKEACSFLKLPASTMNYLIATQQIPYSRLGQRSVRFSRGRLLQWMAEREGVEYRRNKA